MYWSKISLTFLFIVALIGTILRAVPFFSIPFDYENLVHAHSHVAFQGWVYTLMMLLLMSFFLKEHQIRKRRYLLQFKLTVLVIIGVFISFSMQGYGLYSILFSTLFQLLNYWFIYSFISDCGSLDHAVRKAISVRFVTTGLWLGILSTLVPFAIGILAAKGLKGTEEYNSLVYIFLHLQYNGWFLFVAIGLFFKLLEMNGLIVRHSQGIKFYWLFLIAVIPAIALSLLGMSYSKYMLLPAYLAAGSQIAGIIYLLISLPKDLRVLLAKRGNWFQIYLRGFLILLLTKVFLQCLSVFPVFEQYAFHNKLVILAYLHLSLIGVITFLFLALMIERKWLIINHSTKVGNFLLLSGFACTEVLLILGGLGLWYEQSVLLGGSAAMALGILLMIVKGGEEELQVNEQ